MVHLFHGSPQNSLMLLLHRMPQPATRKVKQAYNPEAAYTEKQRASYLIMEAHNIEPDMTGHTAGPLAGLRLTPPNTQPTRHPSPKSSPICQLPVSVK